MPRTVQRNRVDDDDRDVAGLRPPGQERREDKQRQPADLHGLMLAPPRTSVRGSVDIGGTVASMGPASVEISGTGVRLSDIRHSPIANRHYVLITPGPAFAVAFPP